MIEQIVPPMTITRQIPGLYTASPEGTATEFQAVIQRNAPGRWAYRMTVCGLLLEAGERPTLSEARTHVSLVYMTVEEAAR